MNERRAAGSILQAENLIQIKVQNNTYISLRVEKFVKVENKTNKVQLKFRITWNRNATAKGTRKEKEVN